MGGSVLDRINQPSDLKALSPGELRQLADELRASIIEVVTETGGHLASGLGVVELTIALHLAFDSPVDKIVWDVGHQSYPHKLLTGRKERFPTLRQYGGLSGFTCRGESEHDPFGAGHAGTALSAALGLAVARDRRGDKHHVVAVVGDGALTSGLAFEGLNNAGDLGTRLIVILNDNQMSIAPNVGAVARFLNRLRTDARYVHAKAEVEHLLRLLPKGDQAVDILKRLKSSLKGLLLPAMFWEELGFHYLGPADGHDIGALREVLEAAKQVRRPVLIHVYTQKGKGHEPAERDACRFHGVSPNSAPKPSAPTYSQVFGETLAALARADERVIAITAAMADGTGLASFAKEFPKRFFDVGIAEQHAVTFAAGLAAHGLRPFVAIYSTFLQRAYDQVIHDVCIQNLPVVFAIDRAGIVGDDGRTHQGAFDLAYLRCLPNMVVMAPKDEAELQQMLWTALSMEGPVAIRYPRGHGRGVPLQERPPSLPVGQAEVLREGRDLAILALGTMVYPALAAADILEKDGVAPTVINARFAKPLDEALILDACRYCGRLITVEEGVVAGGFGSAVLELLHRHGIAALVKTIGLPDEFIDHGPRKLWLQKYGLTAEGIAQAVRQTFLQLALLGARR